jgi:hypothetical protein
MEQDTKDTKVRSTVEAARKNKAPLIVIILVLIVVGGYAGYRIGSGVNPTLSGVEARNERVTTVDAVYEQVQAQNTLVCASQSYDLYSKVESSNRDLLNLFDVPFTKNKYWMRYVGTIQAGVNLKTAKFTSQNKDKKTGMPKSVVVELDAPKIISNTPDMDKTEIVDEENNILNPIDPDSVVDLQKRCVEQSNKDALNGGLIDQAKSFAKQNLQTMLRGAMGSNVKVTIKWRS